MERIIFRLGNIRDQEEGNMNTDGLGNQSPTIFVGKEILFTEEEFTLLCGYQSIIAMS